MSKSKFSQLLDSVPFRAQWLKARHSSHRPPSGLVEVLIGLLQLSESANVLRSPGGAAVAM
eukprot:1160874-Pelagomonas_calceolata.AAC.5